MHWPSRVTDGPQTSRVPSRFALFLVATLAETELPVSYRKQTTGPQSDRNTLHYFCFRPTFACHLRPFQEAVRSVCVADGPAERDLLPAVDCPSTAGRVQPRAKNFATGCISNRNQGILEIDLTCGKQSPLIFPNRNKWGPSSFDVYSPRWGSSPRVNSPRGICGTPHLCDPFRKALVLRHTNQTPAKPACNLPRCIYYANRLDRLLVTAHP